MAAYNASDVSLSIRMHTKECASHKNTFTNWIEVSSNEMPSFNGYKKGGCYGDYWNTYYLGKEMVGKAVMSHGEISYYKYIKDGVGEEYECDCGMPYINVEGFAQDSLITIKRED